MVEHVLVSEDAAPNTVVHVIQAYDPDGDDVTFAFTGTSQHLFLLLFYQLSVNIIPRKMSKNGSA